MEGALDQGKICLSEGTLQARILDDFLADGWLARAAYDGERAELGTAVILLSEALRQEPTGTLPADNRELALLARVATLNEWLVVRGQVLSGWKSRSYKDIRDGSLVYRLVHPVIEQHLHENVSLTH